ncbi:nucleolin-like [Phalaenopsis equestris]|uniref:nucleolin-like n=1 Tax=Phalaenopsis equestris TaxID=78828 RepID=UPI0009E550E0|nr:nucleolin-like [Phalaenopsis equestris]
MRTRKTDSPKSGPGKKAAQAKKELAAVEKTPESTQKSALKPTPKTSGTKGARGKQSATKAAAAAEVVDASKANAVVAAAVTDSEVDAKEMETSVEVPEKSLEKKVRAKAKSPLSGKLADSSFPKEKETMEEPVAKIEGEEIKENAKEGLQFGTTAILQEELPRLDVTSDKKYEEEDLVISVVGPEIEQMDSKTDADEALEEAVIEIKLESSITKNDELEAIPEVNDVNTTYPHVKGGTRISEGQNDESDGRSEKNAYEDQQMDEAIGRDNLRGTGEEFPSVEAGEGEVEGEGVEGVRDDEEGPKLEEEEKIQISDMAKARKMKKEQEIFVGGLDRDAVEDDLRKAFEKVGEVVEVRLHKDFATNKNKGFAFVKFASKEQVARALEQMKNPLIRGKRCGIAPSEDNDTLFLGNICNTWTKDAVKRKLKDYGIDSVESITLVADTQNEGLSRGFAFLEFACHADAMAAYKRLQKPDVIFGHAERTAKVAFGEPLREPDPEVMAQVKSVFIDGLPPYWDEDQVKEHFKSFGEIERVVLARNMSTAKRKDFGFVNFTNHEAAVACVEGINDSELGDGKSKMKARARLANPLPKTQAVKGGMSGGFRIGHNGIGVYSRFGRGFVRGRFPSNRAGFQGSRGFYPRGRGRGGRFSSASVDNEMPSEFHGWRPYGVQGGRRGSTSGRLGAFDRGRGRGFPSRRPPYSQEGDFSGHFGAAQFGEDPYFYGGGRGLKRPFSMLEHDPSYLATNRLRPRYDLPDPLSAGPRYRDSLGTSGLYSRDYYGSDFGGSSYSSFYGGEPSGGGYFY